MADIETNLGKLTLVQKETGQQVIQWEVPIGLNIDLAYLLKLASTAKDSEKTPGLSDYLESILSELDGIKCYRRSSYSGLRRTYGYGETLVYWNENPKQGYINISCKDRLVDGILESTGMSWDIDTRFSGTKRVRLYSKEGIDLFVEHLMPQLISQ